MRIVIRTDHRAGREMYKGATVWLWPSWAERLHNILRSRGHSVTICDGKQPLCMEVDICYIAGCSTIITKEELERARVVLNCHRGSFSEYRGASALSYQILDGRSSITMTMYEVNEDIDRGRIYDVRQVPIEEHELYASIEAKTWEEYVQMFLTFLDDFESTPVKAELFHEPTKLGKLRKRRQPEDSRIKISETAWKKLRAADNERWPAFFERHGHLYRLHIRQVV